MDQLRAMRRSLAQQRGGGDHLAGAVADSQPSGPIDANGFPSGGQPAMGGGRYPGTSAGGAPSTPTARGTTRDGLPRRSGPAGGLHPAGQTGPHGERPADGQRAADDRGPATVLAGDGPAALLRGGTGPQQSFAGGTGPQQSFASGTGPQPSFAADPQTGHAPPQRSAPPPEQRFGPGGRLRFRGGHETNPTYGTSTETDAARRGGPAPGYGVRPPTGPDHDTVRYGTDGYQEPRSSPGYPQQSGPGANTVDEAVHVAHKEGNDFAESIAREAPALWVEAVSRVGPDALRSGGASAPGVLATDRPPVARRGPGRTAPGVLAGTGARQALSGAGSASRGWRRWVDARDDGGARSSGVPCRQVRRTRRSRRPATGAGQTGRDAGSEIGRAELFVRAGEQWEIAQEFERACAAYQRAIDDGGSTVIDARALRAGALLHLDEVERAQAQLKRLETEGPHGLSTHIHIAEALYAHDDLEGAERWATAGARRHVDGEVTPLRARSADGAAAHPVPYPHRSRLDEDDLDEWAMRSERVASPAAPHRAARPHHPTAPAAAPRPSGTSPRALIAIAPTGA